MSNVSNRRVNDCHLKEREWYCKIKENVKSYNGEGIVQGHDHPCSKRIRYEKEVRREAIKKGINVKRFIS